MTRQLVLAALLAASASASAQQAWVLVEADAGTVVVDDTLQGAVGRALAVAPGARRVRLVDDADGWNPRIDSARVTAVAGDTLRVRLALPVRRRVESVPRGAAIALALPDGSIRDLGTAPLTVDLPAAAQAELVATAEGYESARQPVGASTEVTFVLVPEPGARVPPEVQTFATRRASRRRTLVDLGIGAATLAAGAVAVYYKFEADAVDDQYRDPESLRRGDEALRQEALRLDRRSGVALGVMQAGVGVLALRFVLR